ncbi:streptomycin 6-kinase [Nakamurella sp. UYEF19]|uniref:aminoglycoside phosphotransferase family protein n=1 Tax=Nakamurella sp. UYEF19 TaxID=1756392 RepID=UPI0033936487
MIGPIALPSVVRQRAESLGPAGIEWLRGLPTQVIDLERRWQLTVGELLTGGTAAYVARAVTAAGDDVVLKIAVPDPEFARQVRTLEKAAGRGYVELLEADIGRGAVLMEALGPSLDDLDWSPDRQIEAMCNLLTEAWKVAPDRDVTDSDGPFDKASSLHAFLSRLRDAVDAPCNPEVIRMALEFAERRAGAFDSARCVVVHGDPAPTNTLRVLSPRVGAPGGVVFVDPDGFLGDPEYDLGVILRGWCPQLLAGDAQAVTQHYCEILAGHSGLDAQAIWEWGFVERVSTGLFCLSLGASELGLPFLVTAEMLI